MRKLPASLLVAGLLAAPVAAWAQAAAPAAPEPDYTLAWKLSLYSEYEYRGISQTSQDPAFQLNIDWAHKSGFYLGTFVTNIKWLQDSAEAAGGHTRGQIEWDLFGGYKFEVAKDITLDVGYLRYEYPRSTDFYTSPKVNTDELYFGASWKFLSAKYSYAFSDLFGVPNSEGSSFIEANLAYPLNDWLVLTGHVGHQFVENNKFLGYTVYKLGLTADLGDGWNVGAYYKDTDADPQYYSPKGKDWSRARMVGFVSKTF
jgi:uncharacterized protein (TIGR02001 family)